MDLALAREAASDLAEYADVLDGIVPQFLVEADRFVDAGVNLAEWFREPDVDRAEGRREFASSVSELLPTLLEGQAGLEEYRDVIVGLRGITTELNRASARVATRLDEMFEAINKIVAFCERAIAIVHPRTSRTICDLHSCSLPAFRPRQPWMPSLHGMACS